MRDWPDKIQPKYNQAIFLDRDGTINLDTHYPHNVDELAFIPRALDGISLLSELDVHLIVFSNQAGIPLGIFTREQMSTFNQGILQQVQKGGGRLDAFYYSPYLEPKNLPQDVLPHPSTKPSPGMLFEAAEEFKIDLTKSFVVGDKTSDVVAGQRADCTTILVLTGKAGKEEDAIPIKPDYIVDDLYAAAVLIREQFLANVKSG